MQVSIQIAQPAEFFGDSIEERGMMHDVSVTFGIATVTLTGDFLDVVKVVNASRVDGGCAFGLEELVCNEQNRIAREAIPAR